MARPTAERPRAGPNRRRARTARSHRVPFRWLVPGAMALVALAVAALVYLGPAGGAAGPGAIATLTTSDFHALAFSPNEPDVVFFGHHNGIMRSGDGGKSWRPVVERRNFDAMGLAVSRTDPRRVYLAGHDIFQLSSDGGASWRPVPHDLPGTDIHGFAMSPDDPNRLYAFVVGHGVFQSGDGGEKWERLGGEAPGDVMALVSAGGNPDTLFVGSMRSGVLKTSDGGQSWARAASGLPPGGVMALAAGPGATVYAGIEGGLYKSADGGASWAKLPFPGENAVAIAVSPVRPSQVLGITVKDRKGLLFRSEDGGSTWGPRP